MSQELEFEPDGGAPSLSPPGKWGNDQPAFSSKSDSTRGGHNITSLEWQLKAIWQGHRMLMAPLVCRKWNESWESPRCREEGG